MSDMTVSCVFNSQWVMDKWTKLFHSLFVLATDLNWGIESVHTSLHHFIESL